MKEYKVKPEDLIGDLKGFPIEVVKKMIERQVEQGNPADVGVFQKDSTRGDGGGFYWIDTIEDDDFWCAVIMDKDFSVFFERYPKEQPEPQDSIPDIFEEMREAVEEFDAYFKAFKEEILSKIDKVKGEN